MNAIQLNDRRFLIGLLLLALAAGLFYYFFNEANKKQKLAGNNTQDNAEQRLHQHIAHLGKHFAIGMTQMEQSINGRLDELEYNTRPQLPATTAITERQPIGFKPSYMKPNEA